MHLERKHVLLSLLPLSPPFLGVQAGLIQPNSRMVDLTDPSKLVQIPGLQGLERYVCPQRTNTYLNRRADEQIPAGALALGGPAAQVPREKLESLLQQVKEIERQMGELIAAGGGEVTSGSVKEIERQMGELIAAGGGEVTSGSVDAGSTAGSEGGGGEDVDKDVDVDAGSTARIPEETVGSEKEVTDYISKNLNAPDSVKSPGESVVAGGTTSPIPTTVDSGNEVEDENASITPPNDEEAEPETEPETPITPIKAGPSSEPRLPGVGRPNVLPLPLSNTTTKPSSLPNNNLTTNYKFNPLSHSNIAVYFGQTPHSSSTPLSSLCASPDIDIVVLAFITSRTSGSSLYPTLNLAGTCTTQTPLMMEKAPGLLSCPELADEIKTCQEYRGGDGGSDF
ncbi:hypothetical protein HYFRA_00000534 [Hymenoscyphus fraxineus]|uniref:Uncharacterized protein n=1 Tax=Hymenoscyphus fraxineus TaxID=746836 RepID=A0A9N9L724_9HELO|nr:hypothetical protein HYFRA_00000534 [Hymenoscyphus fraxineus]